MEQAIAQMQETQSSLDTTVTTIQTNVDKISSSVELIAKSQSALQKKFETFMENSHSNKQRQQTDITALIHDVMHEHVYPQLNELFNETNDRFAYLETLLEHAVPPSAHQYESDSDESSQPMDTSTTTDISGHKHHGSPFRTQATPPPKHASQAFTFSPAATPGSSDNKYFPASQDFSGIDEQSHLSGGSE